tara:strand:- start:855 stop:1058 length:204 start_codon:yes stop_codon:yes gene_type:complete
MKHKTTLPKDVLLLLKQQNDIIYFLEDSVDNKLERCDEWLNYNNELYEIKEQIVERLVDQGVVIEND